MLRIFMFALYIGVLGVAWYCHVLLVPAVVHMTVKSVAKRPFSFILMSAVHTKHRHRLRNFIERMGVAVHTWWHQRSVVSKSLLIALGALLCIPWVMVTFKLTNQYVLYLPLPLYASLSMKLIFDGWLPQWLMQRILRRFGERVFHALQDGAWMVLPEGIQLYIVCALHRRAKWIIRHRSTLAALLCWCGLRVKVLRPYPTLRRSMPAE